MRRLASHLIQTLALVAAFAAALQWSIPHGWMLASDGEGHVALTPCPSTSKALVELGRAAQAQTHAHHKDHADHHAGMHNGMDHSGHDEGTGKAQSLCDQAALGVPVLPPIAPELPTGWLVLEPTASITLAAAPGRGLAAPPPPATGPPILTA